MTSWQFVYLVAFLGLCFHGAYMALLKLYDRDVGYGIRLVASVVTLGAYVGIAYGAASLSEHFH